MAKITGITNIKATLSPTEWERLLFLAQIHSSTPEEWLDEHAYMNQTQTVLDLPEINLQIQNHPSFTDIPFQLRVDQYSSAHSFLIEECNNFLKINNLTLRHSNLRIRNCEQFSEVGNNLSIGYTCYLENLPALQKIGTLKAGKLEIINAPSLKILPTYPNIKELSVKDCHALETFPVDFMHTRVEEGIVVEQCDNILSLTEKLWVKERLFIGHCKSFCKLPDDLRVGGSVTLMNLPKLETLPENFVINESLGLIETPLVSFPKNGYVGYHVYISENIPSHVVEALHDWKAQGKIGGDIKLTTSEIYTSSKHKK